MIIAAGTIVGLVLGLLHGGYVYGKLSRAKSPGGPPQHLRGLYYATWTVILWTVFGTYVLVLWLAGAVLFVLFGRHRL